MIGGALRADSVDSEVRGDALTLAADGVVLFIESIAASASTRSQGCIVDKATGALSANTIDQIVVIGAYTPSELEVVHFIHSAFVNASIQGAIVDRV